MDPEIDSYTQLYFPGPYGDEDVFISGREEPGSELRVVAYYVVGGICGMMRVYTLRQYGQ